MANKQGKIFLMKGHSEFVPKLNVISGPSTLLV